MTDSNESQAPPVTQSRCFCPGPGHEAHCPSAQTKSSKPPPSYAPVYCAMYPELAAIAREHGYALAIHGSMQRDFDLVCVPWGEIIAKPSAVVAAFSDHFTLRIIGEPARKPGNRIVYTLSVAWGECAIDLSFIGVPNE